MRGWHYSSDRGLCERDLADLIDTLAIQLYQQLGHRVYLLSRQDIGELVDPYIGDLCSEDQHSIPWMVWDLFQQALEIEMHGR